MHVLAIIKHNIAMNRQNVGFFYNIPKYVSSFYWMTLQAFSK